MQTYIVEPGDNIISIANKFNVNVIDLVKENNLENMYYLIPGLELIIPSININNENIAEDDNVNNNDNFFQYYTVQEGDNLYQIGLKYGLTSQEIASLNGLEVNEYIFPNQKLMIPRQGVKVYFTKNGDSINSIANLLEITSEKIIRANKNIYLLPEQLIVYKS